MALEGGELEAAARLWRAECRQILIMPEGIICYTFTFTYIALVICFYYVNKYKFNLFT